MQYLRKNLILSGWVCLIVGTGVVFSDSGGTLSIIGTTLSLAGVGLIIVGISSKEQGLNPSQIAAWKPSQEDLDDPLASDFENKRVKFRIL